MSIDQGEVVLLVLLNLFDVFDADEHNVFSPGSKTCLVYQVKHLNGINTPQTVSIYGILSHVLSLLLFCVSQGSVLDPLVSLKSLKLQNGTSSITRNGSVKI